MSKKKSTKPRAEYQRIWAAKRRKKLKDQGFKIIRVIVHRDFEKIIKNLAERDFQRRTGPGNAV